MAHWLKMAAVVVWAFLVPIHTLLVVATLLVLADATTGILAAHKRKEPITSAGMRRTVSKLLIYQGAILVGFLIEVMMSGALPVAKLIAGCISAVEGKSCLENLDTVNGSPIFKAIIDRIGSKNDRQ